MDSPIEMTPESPRITLDPKVLVGKPVIGGTQLSVSSWLALWPMDGRSQNPRRLPGVSREDI